MKLISVNIKGFGPYFSEQNIAFPNARKVAVLGQNGAGKTFLLDTVPAALFKTVPNRKGAFYENFSGNDAFIDLTFDLNGDEYRVRRLINAVSRTQKTYIWKNGEALNDGKDAEFAAEIEKLGLNEMTFMAAVYQSQNQSGSVMSMDAVSRIQLLSRILDLLKFDGDYAKAQEAHKAISREIETLGARSGEIARQMPDIEALAVHKLQVQHDHERASLMMVDVEKQIEAAVQTVANARANAQGVDDLRREARNLETEIRASEAMITVLAERIKNDDALIAQREVIEAAVQAIDLGKMELEGLGTDSMAVQLNISQTQTDIDEWRAKNALEAAEINRKLATERNTLTGLESDYRNLQTQYAQANMRKVTAEGKISALRPATEIIDRVPCQGMDINAACELLKNAHQGVRQIEDLTAEIETANQEMIRLEGEITKAYDLVYAGQNVVKEIQDALNALTSQVPPLSDVLKLARERSEALNIQIAACNARIRQAEPTAKHADKLAGALERIADYRAQQAPLIEKVKTNGAALEGKLAKIAAASDIEATINIADEQKARLVEERKGWETDVQSATGHLARLAAEAQKAESLISQLAQLDVELAEQRATLSEVALLREGLGPKGAKNLKIDAAGRAITERANRLIRIGLGPQFSIVINTLRELQSKDEDGNPEVRETLELRIINNDSGEEMLMENLSGGEKAMASLVFSLSLAVEQREACGLDVRTLILDEPSAGLSEENSVKYLDMLDAVLDETGIEQVFFISHMPSMQNLADASIFVTKGQEGQSSTVEVVR